MNIRKEEVILYTIIYSSYISYILWKTEARGSFMDWTHKLSSFIKIFIFIFLFHILS